MVDYVVAPQAPASLAVAGSQSRFPVRRIYCVGRNYAEHAKEMGHSGREEPFFFAKPADAILNVATGETGRMAYPSRTSDLHFEVELVVALSSGGVNLSVEQAAQAVWGYAIGLDMTRRDLQAVAKQKGRPWEVAKAFEQSAPIGPLHPRNETGTLERGAITLSVGGHQRQSGDLSDMIWNVAEAIAHLSTLFELKAGDLLFTGTPAGVGAVTAGETMTASVDGLGELIVDVVSAD